MGSYIGAILLFLIDLPIPVENAEGIENSKRFIFGGFYWTSGFEQLILKNFLGVALLILLGFILGYIIHSILIFIKRK